MPADQFATAGMAWWNALSEPERRAALDAAGPNASVSDAYMRHRFAQDAAESLANREARLALFPKLVEALATTLADSPDFTDAGMYEQKVRRRAAWQLLDEARKLT